MTDSTYIGQIVGGDFAKFCGLLRMYELYYIHIFIINRKAAYNFVKILFFMLSEALSFKICRLFLLKQPIKGF